MDPTPPREMRDPKAPETLIPDVTLPEIGSRAVTPDGTVGTIFAASPGGLPHMGGEPWALVQTGEGTDTLEAHTLEALALG